MLLYNCSFSAFWFIFRISKPIRTNQYLLHQGIFQFQMYLGIPFHAKIMLLCCQNNSLDRQSYLWWIKNWQSKRYFLAYFHFLFILMIRSYYSGKAFKRHDENLPVNCQLLWPSQNIWTLSKIKWKIYLSQSGYNVFYLIF